MESKLEAMDVTVSSGTTLTEWSGGSDGSIVVDGRQLDYRPVRAIEAEVLRSGAWVPVWRDRRPWWKRELEGLVGIGLLFPVPIILISYTDGLATGVAFLAFGTLLAMLKERRQRLVLYAVDGERVRVRLWLVDGRIVVRESFRAEDSWRAYKLASRHKRTRGGLA